MLHRFRAPRPLFGLAVVLVATGLALLLVRDHGPARAHGGAQDELATGRAIYLKDCAVCHGVRGTGTSRGPDLSDVGTASVDFYLSTGRMPMDPTKDPRRAPDRSKPAYEPDVMRAIVRYVDTLIAGPDIPTPDLAGADLASGAELYLLHCAGCHQSIGTGGALAYGRNAPTITEATPVEMAEAVRIGPGTMPAFPPDLLDEAELSDVVAYVEGAVRTPNDRGGWDIGHFGPVTEGLVAWLVGLLLAVLFARWLGVRRKDEHSA